jgi:DNA modification methylase
VTSPPYWGLRDYGVAGQLGLEKTPEEYVEKVVAIFREVWRVLRGDGTLWLNLGDTYAANRGYQVVDNKHIDVGNSKASSVPPGLKPKDLVGIPWRVAFALQADGWYLRQDIIWSKPNPMPESVRDRCTKAHEHIFLLTKNEKYCYDADAVKEPSVYQPGSRKDQKKGEFNSKYAGDVARIGDESFRAIRSTRNRRSVWTITTKPFKEAHFATFPPEIPEICIKAGTSEKGCCPECGTPWKRVVSHKNAVLELSETALQKRAMGLVTQTGGKQVSPAQTTTIGWKPSCHHDFPPAPCVVLDPFSGAGTTGVMAQKLFRKFIGIELNPDYVKMSERRIEKECGGLFDEY